MRISAIRPSAFQGLTASPMTKGWATTVARVATVLCAVAVSSAHAGQADVSPGSACQALQRVDFSAVPDAPTQVMEADVVAATGDVPEHCHVQGYIWPQVGFEMQLPTSSWNGKFLKIGSGGLGGFTRVKGKLVRGWCDDGLRRGYACIVSDQGHHSTKEGNGDNTMTDGLWAYNNLQAQIDYGFRAAHVAAVAGKAITTHYYGQAPKYSYFFGCSGGGRQALIEAQRFPWDFDGIVANDPSINMWGARVAHLWGALAARDAQGQPLLSAADVDLLHQSVVGRCDAQDGLADGVITDPRVCRFDPAELTCKAGQSGDCLSPQQVAVVKKIYEGPLTSSGERLAPNVMPGAYGPMFGAEVVGGFVRDPEYPANFIRNMGFMPAPGPGWKPAEFDFDADYRRFGMVEAIFADNNPDLRRFKAAGGKLIIAQGWHDSGSHMPLNTIDYYETVERTMGGRPATQEFTRLFMMPGRGHCGVGRGGQAGGGINPERQHGGPGANAVDFLGYLESWVEQGRAPEMMIASYIERQVDWSDARSVDSFWGDWGDYVRAPQDPARVRFTRPLYPYPLHARYKGKGDPNDYRNFGPVLAK